MDTSSWPDRPKLPEKRTPRMRLPRRADREFTYGLVASTFQRVRPQRGLGPELGVIDHPLSDAEIERALPSRMPSEALMDKGTLAHARDAATTAPRVRAFCWSAALARVDRRRRPTRHPVLTTYGFVEGTRGVQLAVIRYLAPAAAFRHRERDRVVLDGESFPIVIRPWLFLPHSADALAAGCWTRLTDENGIQLTGLLTTLHALLPKGAQLGDRVRVDARRNEPDGVLRLMDPVMDAAVIVPDHPPARAMQPAPHSTTIGFKDVLLLTGRRDVEAKVIGHAGQSIVIASRGAPVSIPMVFTLNSTLQPGDSGCIALDLELGRHNSPAPPYLMYRGAVVAGTKKREGFGLMLEQPCITWGLELLRPIPVKGTP